MFTINEIPKYIEHVKNDNRVCPVCEGQYPKAIAELMQALQPGAFIRKFQCRYCSAEWLELYALQDITVLDIGKFTATCQSCQKSFDPHWHSHGVPSAEVEQPEEEICETCYRSEQREWKEAEEWVRGDEGESLLDFPDADEAGYGDPVAEQWEG